MGNGVSQNPEDLSTRLSTSSLTFKHAHVVLCPADIILQLRVTPDPIVMDELLSKGRYIAILPDMHGECTIKRFIYVKLLFFLSYPILKHRISSFFSIRWHHPSRLFLIHLGGFSYSYMGL